MIVIKIFWVGNLFHEFLIMLKFLQAKHGREKEFELALQRLRGKNADISEEAMDIKVTLQT